MPATMEAIGAILKSDDFTESDKIVVRWQFQLLGDFETALMGAIARADDGNLEKLRIGFPDHVAGYLNFTRGDLGDRLRGAGLDVWTKPKPIPPDVVIARLHYAMNLARRSFL